MPADERRPQPNPVEREFTTSASNQLYVADITYIPTRDGFLYLVMVMDVFSRRIVGWRMATHLRAELVLNTLNMALWQRDSRDPVILHSEGECTAIRFSQVA